MIEKTRDSRRCGSLFRRYHSDSGILSITIPTKLHERLHLIFRQKYYNQLVRTNREGSWITPDTTTFRPKGHLGGDGGGPGHSSLEAWPTLVIEAGDSESLAALQD